MIDDGLYKIPTINEGVPPVEIIQDHGFELITINREDWRQVEFVSLELEYFIESGFGPIRTIYREHKTGKLFNQIHKRTSLEEPLDEVILLQAEIDGYFDGSIIKTDGLALGTADHLIQHGFAYRVNGLCLYGVTVNQNVSILGLHPVGDSLNDCDVSRLVDLAKDKGLFLVDWRNMLRLSPNLEIYSQYFLGD